MMMMRSWSRIPATFYIGFIKLEEEMSAERETDGEEDSDVCFFFC